MPRWPNGPTSAERAAESPAFKEAYARLERSGIFAEFDRALRLDASYSIEIAQAASRASRSA